MAKIDFFLVVLLIPCNEILCALPGNGISLTRRNQITNHRPSKFNTTSISKSYNGRHSSKPNKAPLNKNKKDNESDHKIPYSEHENPRDVSTRPKYTATGQLVRPTNKEDLIDFVPTKVYAQVRGKHTVKRLPQKYAVEEATTDEEKENANRLREVVTNKKTNTVYTEEGYEDSAYDHAGHIRDADFAEGYGKKLKNKYDEKAEGNYPNKEENVIGSDEDVDEAESTGRVKINNDIHPKRVVVKGIRKLENDIMREIEKTDKDADEYHERISQIRASEENDDEDDDEDEYDDDDEDQDNGSYSHSLEKDDTKNVDFSHDNEDVSADRHSDDVSYKVREPIQEDSNSYEHSRSNEYKTDSTTTNSKESGLYSTTVSYKMNELPTEPTLKLNFGDILWEGFKERQKQRGLINPNKLESSDEKQNPSSLANNNQLYFEKLAVTPITLEPLTAKPISLGLNDPINTYQNSGIFSNFKNPLEVGKIEAWTLAPPRPEPLISFDPVTNPTFYNYKEKVTTLSYPETFLETTYPPPTTTPKRTEYDHNPFLSQFARQFDGKLKRYKLLDRNQNKNKPINIKIDDELRPPKYSNQSRSSNSLDSHLVSKDNYYNGKYHNKVNNYKPQPIMYKQQNSVPSVKALRLIKPPKFSKLRVIPKTVSKHRRPALGNSGHYDPILNDYILPRIIKGHFYPTLGINPRQSGFRRLYSVYNPSTTKNNDALSSYIYPTRIVKPRHEIYSRRKRSLNVLNQILNTNNSIDNVKNSDGGKKNKRATKYKSHTDLLGKSPQIAEDVVEKEIALRFPNSEEVKNQESTESKKSKNENVDVEVPEIDGFLDDKEEYEKEDYPDPEEEKIDTEKYPYYDSDLSKQDSTVKYILNPNYVPKKTFGGMEFYDSRILECKEIDPNLDDVNPDGEEPTTTSGYNEDLPRLTGLGNKLDCFKAKYFDPNPLDNPLFIEKRIGNFEIPEEIDSKAFSSKISEWSGERDDYINQKLSKKPEYGSKRQNNTLKRQNTNRNNRYRYPILHRHKYPRKNYSIEKIMKGRKKKRRPLNQSLVPLRLYGNQVYDDVMGTIKKSKKPKRHYIQKHPDSSTRIKHYTRPVDSDEELSAVKLRFVSNNSRDRKTSSQDQITSNASEIPIVDIPSLQKPKRVRILRGGPYKAINISKPKGGNLIVNYRVLPETKNYHKKEVYESSYRGHKRHKRSVAVDPNDKVIDTNVSIVTNSHQIKVSPVFVDESLVQNNTRKVVYKVPVRRKNSKPEGDTGKYGKIVSDSTSSRTTDRRRQEPRYNPIREPNEEQEVTNNSPLRIIVKDPVKEDEDPVEIIKNPVKIEKDFLKIQNKVPYEFSFPTETIIRIDHGSHYNRTKPSEIQESAPKKKVYKNIERNEQNFTRPIIYEVLPKKVGKRYEVHEVQQEEEEEEEEVEETKKPKLNPVPGSTPKPILTDYSTEAEKGNPKQEPGTISNIGDYSTESEEEAEESSNSKNDKLEKEENRNSDDEENPSNEEETSANDGSSEENYRSNSSSEDEDQSGEEEDDDKHSFSRFTYRPYSPPEYFEDIKYADLGPRINKPAFYHPTFTVPKYERYKYGKNVDDVHDDSYESVEREKKYKYTYPWDKRDSDEESNHFIHTIKRYEYPWEKRERLAREREKKKHYYDSEEEDNDEKGEETASSEDHLTYHSPWNVKVFETPERKNKNKKNVLAYDNEEGTSNIKATVTNPKIKPNITVSEVNRTVIRVIKHQPILPINKIFRTKSVNNQTYNVTTSSPFTSTIQEIVFVENVTVHPSIASIPEKSNIEILKTNPRRRGLRTDLPGENSTSTTTTSPQFSTSPNLRRRRGRVVSNPNIIASSTTQASVRNRKRLVRFSTDSSKPL